MNYMEARKLSDGSGWHMTIRNDDRIWTHSCCRTQVPATEEDVRFLASRLLQTKADQRDFNRILSGRAPYRRRTAE